jgi:hypothetical protein
VTILVGVTWAFNSGEGNGFFFPYASIMRSTGSTNLSERALTS